MVDCRSDDSSASNLSRRDDTRSRADATTRRMFPRLPSQRFNKLSTWSSPLVNVHWPYSPLCLFPGHEKHEIAKGTEVLHGVALRGEASPGPERRENRSKDTIER